jgi:hypothetical protein
MKWVCVTKYWENFTYGKVYEGDISGSLLDVENNIGERTLPALYRKECTEYLLEPTKKIYYFIPLEEWREQQIEKIL